ncbi:hypothetical protein NEAUS04_1011 [Nematocida ausubeli]|nr:hypothetical protein NEAUS04_1011 [Nematocida ausubeli]
MKIFSVLLLRCKKPSCTHSNYLVPDGCTIKWSIRQPESKDFAFLQAQLQVICMMNLSTNEFILPYILNAAKECLAAEDPAREYFNYDIDFFEKSFEKNSFELIDDKKAITNLFTALLCAKLEEGTLRCAECHMAYPIYDGVPNLLTKQDIEY